MRVIVVCHYFPPEIGAPQARLSELARAWARAGDQVTVLTGMPNHPTGVVPEDYRGRVCMAEEVDGYRIVRTWLYATPNTGMLKKTLGHLSFMVTSLALGFRRTGKADVVVVSSPTFFSVFSAWALARWKRAALVVEVRDLWPAIFVELGVLQNRRVIRLLEVLELAAYRAAAAVVVVTEGFRDDLVRRGVPAGKVHVIPNGAELERFTQEAGDKDSARTGLGASPSETLVLYVGAHGISHALEAVAEAAAKLAGEPIHFAFVGEGAQKEALEARVRELGVTNVTMLPSVARDQIPGLLAAADICLVPLATFPCSPRSSRPRCSSTWRRPRRSSAASGGSRHASSERRVRSSSSRRTPAPLPTPSETSPPPPSERAAMGRQGRAYVAEHFDRAKLADRYRSVLAQVRPS